ncbi:MAG: response regulator [Blastocatellia bacterium]|jgi:DNA-binding NtrC family response regulator|nr:response regulator [Blastocatellia bacterium]MBK6425790.1 response regulator [Blastocatellia bacterium]
MARVLVIDDDPGIRDVCREILEQAGYSVDDAPDGAVGLKMFALAPYQVVLCDIFMPNMDGIETISELVRTYVAVSVVAMSGGAVGLPDYLSSARKFGAVSELPKPFTAGELLDAVGSAIESGRD